MIATLTAYRRLLANGPLVRLLGGEFVSSIGDWLYMVAVLVVVWDVTGDPVLLGVVGLARVAPQVVLSVPAGIVADRFDRRLILIATDLVRGALMLVLAWLALTDGPVAAIVAVSIVASAAATFFGPAISGYLPRVVGDEAQLGPANSAWATLDSLAFIIGPGVAGVLIAVGGLPAAFLLNAASFAVCALVLLGLPHGRPEPAPAVDPGDEDGALAPAGGWQRVVAAAPGPIALDAATAVAGGGLSVLTVLIAVESLGAGEAATGWLNAATGVGGVVAGVVAGALTLRRLDRPLILAALLGAVTLGVLGLTTSLGVALVAIGVAVGALLVLDIANATIVQRSVPDDIRGRTSGLLGTTGMLVYGAASFLAPVLSVTIGVGATLALMGAVLAALTGLAVVLLGRAGALVPSAPDPVRLRLLDAPVFAGLPAARRESIALRLVPLDVPAGTLVIRQGDPADRFYLVESGAFRVTQTVGDPDAGERELRILGAGDVFGEIGLLSGGPRTATVSAVGPGRLWALDADAFTELVAAGPGLGSRLLDLYRGAGSRAG